MKNKKLFWLGLVLVVLALSSMACQDLIPQAKTTAPAMTQSAQPVNQYSQGHHNTTHFYRFLHK